VVVLVLTMVRNRAEARRIAAALVSEKLAACVSAVPGAISTYRWRGKVERSREVHSYELPEVVAVKVDRGLPEYLKWVEKSLI
jgi:periplasmic divalent cation tolerance protein